MIYKCVYMVDPSPRALSFGSGGSMSPNNNTKQRNVTIITVLEKQM